MQGILKSVFGSSSWVIDPVGHFLLAALLLVVALAFGWLLGVLARGVFMLFFGRRVEDLSRRLGYKQLEQTLRLRVSLATLVGWGVQVLVTGAALLLLANVYFPASVEVLLVRGIGYLPTLLIALAIVLVGLFLSQLLADLTFTAARAAKRADAPLLSMGVRVGVVVLGVAASLLELGVATIFITALLVAVLGMAALAAGLALGLGASDYVRDLLAGRVVRAQLHPGQRVAIDDVTGVVVECGPNATLIATDDGKRTLLPNKLITQKSVVLG
jgi:small-conductance mechanosensitive channel